MQRVMKELLSLGKWFFSRKGLLLIVGVLIWITVTSFHPDQYLIGWDNYSAYLGGMDGLFRTIFSTWRSYRGIGVPSDSESADIFRQLIILVLSPFVAEQLRDQLYVLGCLWVGVLSVYVIVSRFMRRLETTEKYIDVIATISASVYLFNLNTLATFYFPIITYITRFAALPLLVLVFDIFIRSKKITWRVMFLFIIANLFASGSYLTATVFLTTAVLLGVFVLFQGSWKRGVIAFVIFVALQAYWFVPFVNYTIQKSESLRLAPVFVDTNEAQLNLKAEAYSVKNQLIVYPNFFETRFQSASNPSIMQAFHPITDALQNRLMQYVLYIFPVFAILGCLFIVITRKRYGSMFWVPIIYTFYVLVSSQEYSWFGFIPAFLNRYIPYFTVIFRFGDTKFHPYIILSGAVAVGVFMHELYLFVAKKKIQTGILSIVLALLVIGLPITTVYRSYFTGDLLPNFLFVKIPNEYRQIANTINSSNKNGRVLHLPYDPSLYWRSYSWGYLGSAFFQDLLHVPYLDKTFEPASLETTDFFARLSTLIQDASDATIDGKQALAEKIARLLTDYSIRWIIVDSSVSANVPAKNAVYWGQYNMEDSVSLISSLWDFGFVKQTNKIELLTLYEVNDFVALMSSIPSVSLIDSELTHVSINNFNNSYIQQKSSDAIIYPLLHKDFKISFNDKGIALTHGISQELRGNTGVLQLESINDQKLIDVRLVVTHGNATIEISEVVAPAIQASKHISNLKSIPLSATVASRLKERYSDASLYRANWHVLGYKTYSPLRLAVDGIVLPVPTIENDGTYPLGTVLVSKPDISVEMLVSDMVSTISRSSLFFTDNPNCFGDRLNGYTYSYQNGVLHTNNGTSCLVTTLDDRKTSYIEASIQYESNTSFGGDGLVSEYSAKPSVSKEIFSLLKPVQLSTCIQDASFDTCANFHTIVKVEKSGQFIIPSERLLFNGADRIIRFALMSQGAQSIDFTIKNLSLTSFRSMMQSMVSLQRKDREEAQILFDSDTLHMKLPFVFSTGSYYFQKEKDGFGITNQPCQTNAAYRTVKKVGDSYLSYLSNCYAEFSTSVPFSNETMKLWIASYVLYSGKYPKFILKDAILSYSDSYFSFDQGYPHVAGNLGFESPEQWYRRYTPAFIREQLSRAPITTYTIVSSRHEIEDSRNKNYTIHQNSQNEGIFRLDSQDVIELPASWEKMQIRVGNPQKLYGTPENIVSKKLLPSLWKVTITGLSDRPMLLRQNEGYDHQWKAFGVGTSIEPVKCNGFANCYELKSNGTYYLLYTPELLTILGWLMTLAAIAVCLITARERE